MSAFIEVTDNFDGSKVLVNVDQIAGVRAGRVTSRAILTLRVDESTDDYATESTRYRRSLEARESYEDFLSRLTRVAAGVNRPKASK